YPSQKREVNAMSFPNKNQCIQCEVSSCKHHSSDGLCELDTVKIAPRCGCNSGNCDESECASYKA
ncbi:MAG: DUF1540 domain-containing protein, partial [Clostridia bacterium]